MILGQNQWKTKEINGFPLFFIDFDQKSWKLLFFLAKKVPITHQNTLKSKKIPEMNELEPRQKILKIWTHNFEKQKSYRILKI